MRTTNDKLIQGYIAAKERRRDVGKILTIIGVLMMVASIAASAFVLDWLILTTIIGFMVFACGSYLTYS
mgnify:FL=1